MKTLTPTQRTLLDKILLYKYVKNSNGIFNYDDMKNICDFKSFDMTFNALLNMGYLQHFATNDFSNKYIISNPKN